MSLEELEAQIKRCRKCSLWRTRKKAVPGEGSRRARIFLVGEAPGREEDEKGRPFVGPAGKMLDRCLEKAGLERRSVFITSVLKCRPPRNRNPRREEIEKCRPYLVAYIDEIDPDVVVALGSFGYKALSGRPARVSDSRKALGEYEGRVLVSTYHPAAVLYNRRLMEYLVSDLRKARKLAKSDRVRIISQPAKRGKKTVVLQSAGGVVAKRGRVLLIHKRSERIWCLPKGHVEKGETLEQAALREVKEETGLVQLKIDKSLGNVEYSYYWPQEGVNYRKRVTYFLTRTSGGQKPRLESRFDKYRWCTRAEANNLLHHSNDIDVVRRAFDVL